MKEAHSISQSSCCTMLFVNILTELNKWVVITKGSDHFMLFFQKLQAFLHLSQKSAYNKSTIFYLLSYQKTTTKTTEKSYVCS